MNKRALPLLVAALTLLLAACTIRTVTDVKSDGSAVFTMEFGFTDQELTSMEQFGMSSDTDAGVCNMGQSMGAEMPADITFEEVKRGDTTWCTYNRSFKNLEEMKTYFADEMEMEINRLEIKDGKFYYDVKTGDTTSMSDMSGLPITMTYEWVLKVPGKVGANNATKVEGQTLTWDLTASNMPDSLKAESDIGGGGGLFGLDQTTLIILVIGGGCCILAVIAIAAVVLFLVARRKPAA
jgi:predicted small secreted protein